MCLSSSRTSTTAGGGGGTSSSSSPPNRSMTLSASDDDMSEATEGSGAVIVTTRTERGVGGEDIEDAEVGECERVGGRCCDKNKVFLGLSIYNEISILGRQIVKSPVPCSDP